MSGWRAQGGHSIDRNRPLSFNWEGRSYTGYAGDTLASALMANGVSIIGRSFKYHRPRGLMAAGLEEPNAIVQLEKGEHTVPNVKATQIELYDGLVAKPVNVRPRAGFDLMAVNSAFKRFIPAAFYYKTFFWPNWHAFEPAIRKAAGLGTAPEERDADAYDHRFAHFDTLVVGSGAAGLAAAETAAREGGRIAIVEADAEFGGGLLWALDPVEGLDALAWRDGALERLRAMPNVSMFNRTMAFGFYDHGLVALVERITDHLPPTWRTGPRQRIWKVRCCKVILATGAFERPVPFAGNDLPGVMLASAAQTYACRFGALPGRRIAVCTNNESAYEAAITLKEAGCDIAAIVDSRADPGPALARAEQCGIKVLRGAAPVAAHGRRGVRSLAVEFLSGGQKRAFECDAILTSDGWNPAVHLHSQSGGGLAYDDALQAFLPSRSVQAASSVGSAAGVLNMADAIAQARGEAAAHVKQAVGPTRRFADGDAAARSAWLDFQNDVTVGDVQLAARENFRSVEHLKRYTTLGMASDQGKTSNVAGIQALSGLLEKPAEAIGTTKFRPPFDPVTIGAFAGRAVGEDLMPLAQVPSRNSRFARGALSEAYGRWERAACYAQAGEDEHAAIVREVMAVRESVGLFDASPLGKIEVKGPDAAEFLQRMYVGGIRALKVGRCRYGMMLSEHGIVYDDGILARISTSHFLVGTTSGNAARVTEAFHEWLQCEWPDLRVAVENVTTGWAVMNVAGPCARAVLEAVGTNIDLDPTSFPHMSFRSGRICGVTARVQRVSFSGELSYEVAVPWSYGRALWDAMMEAGAPFGIAPFGIESLMVMRVEKGFLHVGSDTDGTTYPQDIGFAEVVFRKKDDFVGRRSTMRPDGLREDRRQLVGLEVADGCAPLEIGSHVLPMDATAPCATDGWITSSVYSPTLGRPLALALVRSGTQRMGEEVRIWDLGKSRTARIVDCKFYDPAGERLND